MLAFALAALTACEQQQPLFTAECNDGTRIAGAKEVVEARCGRHRGVRSIAPLTEGEEPATQNAQNVTAPPGR